jgi:hypothetical protein
MIRLSVTSKLDGIKSWSLQALDTCPASKNRDGTLVDACIGCYATTGNYRFPNVKQPRLENRDDWKRDAWVSEMIVLLDSDRYFRWFDSGDMYSIDLAQKMLEVMKLTPWVKHWLPTRMQKFPKFKSVLTKMRSLPNVSVRFSSDSVNGGYTEAHGSTIIPNVDFSTHAKICEAYTDENAGKCNGCRACWDKSVPVIAYVAHGKKMQKHIAMRAI